MKRLILLVIAISCSVVSGDFSRRGDLFAGPGLDVKTSSRIGPISFTGSGLNDLTVGGTYAGDFQVTLKIEIDGEGTPDTFKWTVTDGSPWARETIDITESSQYLSNLNYNGIQVSVTFGATTGHTAGDYWECVLYPAQHKINTTGAYYLDGEVFATYFPIGSVVVGSGILAQGKNSGYCLTGLGRNIFAYNTTGYCNTAVGYSNMNVNTTGYYNTSLGYAALRDNTTGHNNVAIGAQAMWEASSGYQNVAIGSSTLKYISDGFGNVMIGYAAGSDANGADLNIGIGWSALENITSGQNNTVVGGQAGMQLTTTNGNTLFGRHAGMNLTGTSNIFLGYHAGRNQTNVSNTFILDNQNRGSAATEQAEALFHGTFDADPNNQTLRINAQMRFNDDVNSVSADHNYAQNYGTTIIDTSGAAMDPNLADGTYTGQTCTFTVKTAGNNFSLNILHHVTSDPEVLLLDTAEDNVTLIWDGTDWVVKSGSGYTYP